MSTVSLVAMAQIATLMISIAEALLFGHTLCSSKHPEPIWEPFWVTMVECICYIVQIGSNSFRFEMADGALINVISPMAWMLACPVAMSFMMRISWPEVSPRVNIALIMNLEAVILLGLLSGMTNDWTLKLVMFITACLLYVLLCTMLLRGMFFSGVERPREAKNILLFFMGTWMLFPTVWILGPNMTAVWSYEMTLTFFAFGDIFSKNIFTYIGYKYTLSLLAKDDGDEDLSKTKPKLSSSLHLSNNKPKPEEQKKTHLDPLMIARIIQHLEEGGVARDSGHGPLETKQRLQKSSLQMHQMHKYDPDAKNKFHTETSFPTDFFQGSFMTGITKDTGEKVDFTILKSSTQLTPYGSSIKHIEARTDRTDFNFNFTIMRNDSDVICDKFHVIKSRQSTMAMTTAVTSMTTPTAKTPERYHQLPLIPSSSADPVLHSPINWNHADVKSDKQQALPFELFDEKGSVLYAWNNGKAKEIHVKSSNIMSLGNDKNDNRNVKREAYIIVYTADEGDYDNGGPTDTSVIITEVDKNGERLILDSKWDNLTFTKKENDGHEASHLTDLFPALKKRTPAPWSQSNRTTVREVPLTSDPTLSGA